MQIELKSLKVNQRESQETLAFSANLYINGKKAATVGNHGTGGCNHYDFPDRATRHAFEAYAKQWGAERGETFEPADALIQDLIERADIAKVVRSNAKRGFPVTLVGMRGGMEVAGRTHYAQTVYLGLRSRDQVEEIAAKERLEAYEIMEA
jgi:hypothetical protein